jgi:hypothetical protein
MLAARSARAAVMGRKQSSSASDSSEKACASMTADRFGWSASAGVRVLSDGGSGIRSGRGKDEKNVHRQTQETLSRLVAVYDAWSRPDRARAYRAELAASIGPVTLRCKVIFPKSFHDFPSSSQ